VPFSLIPIRRPGPWTDRRLATHFTYLFTAHCTHTSTLYFPSLLVSLSSETRIPESHPPLVQPTFGARISNYPPTTAFHLYLPPSCVRNYHPTDLRTSPHTSDWLIGLCHPNSQSPRPPAPYPLPGPGAKQRRTRRLCWIVCSPIVRAPSLLSPILRTSTALHGPARRCTVVRGHMSRWVACTAFLGWMMVVDKFISDAPDIRHRYHKPPPSPHNSLVFQLRYAMVVGFLDRESSVPVSCSRLVWLVCTYQLQRCGITTRPLSSRRHFFFVV
jgi:hypothetical protein